MAKAQQNELAVLVDRIQNHLQDINIWQLLRLIKLHVKKSNDFLSNVHFRTDGHLRFPENNIRSIQYNKSTDQVTLAINFIGLLGGSGILPLYYSELSFKQRRLNNYELIDLIDALQQQSIKYYCQAFERSRIYFYRENYYLGITDNDPVDSLMSYLGKSILLNNDGKKISNVFLSYFAHTTRSVYGLQQILCQCLQVPIDIQEFTKHKVTLESGDTTKLSRYSDSNNRLSTSFTLGENMRLDAFHFTIIVRLQSYHQMQYLKYKKIWCKLINQLVQCYLANAGHYQIKFMFSGHVSYRLGKDFYLGFF